MKIEWSTKLGRHLRPRADHQIWSLFHENSKLSLQLSSVDVTAFAVSPVELHVTSRGFWQYRSLPQVTLPPSRPSQRDLARIMLRRRSRRDLTEPLTLAQLAIVLTQALGPTQVSRNEQHDVDQVLRAWPSAGALYPLETYVVAGSVEGLSPGIYHFNCIEGALAQLSSQPVENVLQRGFLRQEMCRTAAVVLLFVAVFERTVAKYGERGYRLVLLDAGHAAQNLLLVAEQEGLAACPVSGFADDALAQELGIDGVRQAVVHAVVLGGRPHE